MADGASVSAAGPRVLYLGMAGSFSVPPLEALLGAGVVVCAVLLPKKLLRQRPIPPTPALRELSPGLPVMAPTPSIGQIAWRCGIPLFEVADLSARETLATVRTWKPDAIAVACFDRLIPREFRELAPLAVNVHPSLLPENRGPAPLFWTFRLGLATTGVTVHLLEDRADAGAIVAQRELSVPPGIEGAELDRRLARLGGELLLQTVRQFQAGQLHTRPQDESLATAYPWPSEEDWLIPADWPPQRALNFTRGVAHLGGPLRPAPG